ncbi:MAG: hypothetical protein LWX56_08620 [Ignavibacteria bacterium]|nr:hypothetical protein [Ignavibacteria bacterium]
MVALFVALTFIIFLVIDFFVLRSQKKVHPAFMPNSVFDKSSIYFPGKYLLSKGHIWLQALKNDTYKLGLDEFVVRAMNNIVINTIAEEGTKIKKGDVLFSGTAGGHPVAFYAPVGGTVSQINTNILNKNIEDIYNEDWGVILQVESQAKIQEIAFEAVKAKAWMQSEFKRLKDFLTIQTAEPELAGLTMADGGNIAEGAVSMLSDKVVAAFENDFLKQ